MHGNHLVRMALLLVIVGLTTTLGGSLRAHAATTRVWIGAANNPYWSSPGNWSPTGAPVDGDSVIFPAATLDSNQNNDLGNFDIIANRFVPLTLNSLTLNKPVLMVGNRVAISSTLSVGVPGIAPILDFPIELAGNVQVSVPNGATLYVSSGGFAQATVSIDMAGHTLTKTGTGLLDIGENVVGSGTFTAAAGPTMIRYLYPLAFSGTMAMGSGTTLSFQPSTLSCGAPNAAIMLSNATMTMPCPGSVGSLAGTGTVNITGPVPKLTITVTGETFDGPLTGAATATFSCCGEGVQTLKGASTFAGAVLVKTGSLLLAGATFPSTSLFTVQGKGAFPATLGGYGTFGTSALATAVLDLESVDGAFGLAKFPRLTLAPDVEVDYEIKGPTPGANFTQIVATDKVDIANARLSLDFGNYVPAPGQSFTLIKGTTTGTFRNVADDAPLAEGTVFSVGNLQFKISYSAAAGGVVITRQGGASTPTPTPTATPTTTPTPQPKNKRFLPGLARDN